LAETARSEHLAASRTRHVGQRVERRGACSSTVTASLSGVHQLAVRSSFLDRHRSSLLATSIGALL
jgi:hypothetical protein